MLLQVVHPVAHQVIPQVAHQVIHQAVPPYHQVTHNTWLKVLTVKYPVQS